MSNPLTRLASPRCWRSSSPGSRVLHSPAFPPLSVRRAPMDRTGTDASDANDRRWETLKAALMRAVLRRCPAWLRNDAEDIAQVAITKVMAADRASEGERSLTSFYLYKVAHSALVDEIRRRARRREQPLDADGEEHERHTPEPAARGNPEDDARFRQLGEAVRLCLGVMKRERRLAVVLYLQQHTVPEVARILGWAVKRTENLVYRGLADLRQCLLAKGHTP
jgi:RNA polymerase sigma-70 factor, ECF subfamily